MTLAPFLVSDCIGCARMHPLLAFYIFVFTIIAGWLPTSFKQLLAVLYYNIASMVFYANPLTPAPVIGDLLQGYLHFPLRHRQKKFWSPTTGPPPGYRRYFGVQQPPPLFTGDIFPVVGQVGVRVVSFTAPNRQRSARLLMSNIFLCWWLMLDMFAVNNIPRARGIPKQHLLERVSRSDKK